MNREEAVKFNEELKAFMEKQAAELGLDKGSGASLVDQYIEIYPDELPMMGMFDLNEKGSVSVKPGNVLVHQKKYLMFALGDWVVSLALPKTILNYIQLCLLTGMTVYNAMEIGLDERESYVVAYLHFHQMYDRGEPEEVFYVNFPRWYKQQTGDEISADRLRRAINSLLDLKSIKFENGEIRLKERVWRNRLTE
ncbi:MAG: hypothetical protein HFI17_19005 [Lachnospiraceae bacterium]|jgi:hypothetical protein|nr:hypothetical protein [Lachnospiraceae bacterium]